VRAVISAREVSVGFAAITMARRTVDLPDVNVAAHQIRFSDQTDMFRTQH
jgi:hypothetical protein